MRVCAGQLSQGELQRLALARVLFQAPQLAIMDEATSALSACQSDRLWNLLHESGIAVLATAQLGSPRHPLFARVLTLHAEGAWTLEAAA